MRVVLLDRDGVINACPRPHEYVRTPGELRWLPGAAAALGRLCAGGFSLAIVSNQRGLSSGALSWEELRAVDAHIEATLAAAGARIATFHYCGHAGDDGCGCRKPAPGLLIDALNVLREPASESVMIGDHETDVAAGIAAGCRTVRIGPPSTRTAADLLVANLAAAAEALLRGALDRSAA